jgi:ABC-type multidrug transport system permease subunit
MKRLAKVISVFFVVLLFFATFFFPQKKANAWFGYGKNVAVKVEHNSQLVTVSCCKQSVKMSCQRGAGNDCEMGGIF